MKQTVVRANALYKRSIRKTLFWLWSRAKARKIREQRREDRRMMRGQSVSLPLLPPRADAPEDPAVPRAFRSLGPSPERPTKLPDALALRGLGADGAGKDKGAAPGDDDDDSFALFRFDSRTREFK